MSRKTFYTFSVDERVKSIVEAEIKRLRTEVPGSPATISAALRNLILKVSEQSNA